MADGLASFAASHPGLSLSAAAKLLVDEGLRMAEHLGIVFGDGPTGRRAGADLDNGSRAGTRFIGVVAALGKLVDQDAPAPDAVVFLQR